MFTFATANGWAYTWPSSVVSNSRPKFVVIELAAWVDFTVAGVSTVSDKSAPVLPGVL